MPYYISKTLDLDFENGIQRVASALKAEGFGVLTEIDVTATMKEKPDVDFRKYRILGACNPPFVREALKAEDKIGTMLPCNVIVQEIGPDRLEVAAVNPVSSMLAVENEALLGIAGEIQGRLKRVIESLDGEAG